MQTAGADMTPNDLDRKARELLAVEYEKAGYPSYSGLARSGRGEFTLCSIRAIEAALRLAVPDGFVVVPREPTQEMWDAATNRVKANTVVIDAGPAKGSTLMRDPIAHTWYAMIAAAPTLADEGE